MTIRWEPLLDGDEAATALERVAAIAADLRTAPDEAPDLQGAAGRAVFCAYVVPLGFADDAEAASALEAALLGTARESPSVGLWDGCTGVRWVLAHLADRDDADGAIATLDATIARASEPPWTGRVDLYRGLAGIALIYADEAPALREPILARILDVLEARGIATPTDGPGVAHGVAGLIACLAYHVPSSADPPRLHRVLNALVDWMLVHRERTGRTRPDWAGARIGWCHGDSGIALAMLAAARVLDRPELERLAIDLALTGDARDVVPEMDASLCHGAAGLAHLANRMYQTTGHDELADRARTWLRRTLEQAQPGVGLGGYLMCRRKGPSSTWWRPDSSVLVGSAGVGLALVAGATGHEPGWDRLLAADVAAAVGATP